MVNNIIRVKQKKKKDYWRLSYYIFDSFRVPRGRVRSGVSTGRRRPAPPTVGRTLDEGTKGRRDEVCAKKAEKGEMY